jgi:hypothetical protein
MLTTVSSQARAVENSTAHIRKRSSQAEVGDLTALAVKGLERMFDVEKQMFCFTLKLTERGFAQEGLSTRYTIMSLLGLHRLETAGFASPIPVQAVLDRHLRTFLHIANTGDLGLTLWLCALVSPERLEEVYAEVAAALPRLLRTRVRKTMELAWLLSGLSHAGAVPGQKLVGVSQLAAETYELLQANQGRGGAFGHQAQEGSLAGLFRGHIGSFADQVYPIYALAKFAEVFQHRNALTSAKKCADTICRAQGSLGQWWWHYNSQTGGVFEYYPVYAVHQHGMAPMALFALTEASQLDFTEPIYKGLQWIAGENELGLDLRASSPGVVWRNLYHKGSYRKRLGNALALAGLTRDRRVANLKINFECRPYELGWLLYAFAGRAGVNGPEVRNSR